MNYHKHHKVILNESKDGWYATIHDTRIGWNVYESGYYPTEYDAIKYAVSYIDNRMRG